MSQTLLKEAFAYLRLQNVHRTTNEFDHMLSDWSTLEWAGAMCGEAGEAANIAKKILRLDCGLKAFKGSNQTPREEYIAQLGDELADTVIYADLCAAKANIDLVKHIIGKFNRTSDEYGAKTKL